MRLTLLVVSILYPLASFAADDVVEPDFVLEADTNHFQLGIALTTPDLNGDGVADLAASHLTESRHRREAVFRSGAYVAFGPAIGTAGADVAITGAPPNGECVRAWDLSSGDANGDGQDDLLVGAPCDTSFLLLGPVTGNRQTDGAEVRFVSDGSIESSVFTTAISPDMDGDGMAELLLASPYDASGAGSVYVVSGAPSGSVDLSVDATYRFNGEGGGLGLNALHDVGDTNGDGITDLAIGGAGKVYVVAGGAAPGTYDVDAAAIATVRGGDRSPGFAANITAGDFDGDGTPDLIVGGNGNHHEPRMASVFAFLGPLEGDANAKDANATWFDRGGNVYMGGGLAVGGDVDGDGSADMLVGTRSGKGGSVFVQLGWVTGSVLLTDLPSIPALGDDNLGDSVAFLSDWSGDGVDEIAAGAPTAPGEDSSGAVYVFLSDQLF